MPHIHISRRPALAVPVIVLLSVVLAACGSSSSTSSTSTGASAATSTAPAGVPGVVGGRFKALRECLAKNGITLPKRTPGQAGSPGGLLGGGAGPQLPAGVTRAQYEAAVKKCGGGAGPYGGGLRPGRLGGSAGLSSPTVKAALVKFASCMRSNGQNVPEPNTSGNGPIFDTKALNTTSTQFRAATAKCSIDLRGAFGARPGSVAPPAPPAG